MDFFRKMSFADSTGDAIPFYHEGKYHIFSLTSPPGTTVYPARLRTTWSHSVSEDLVHWEELPTALYPGEGDEPDASGVWTGSVIYGEGKYHAFYTGYCLTAEYQQTICHATSEDGITWTKDAANPVITPMIELYEKLDWRDPYVFYNEEDKCYWILISARRLDIKRPQVQLLSLGPKVSPYRTHLFFMFRYFLPHFLVYDIICICII